MEYWERALKNKEKLDAEDRLILVQVKIKRAEKHLRDLATEVLPLTDTTILTTDPNTGLPPNPIVIFSPNNFQKVPTLSFNVVAIAGDVIHNLRSALDHLARQLVLVGMDCAPVMPLNEKELRRIEFPIGGLLRNTNPKRLLKQSECCQKRSKQLIGSNHTKAGMMRSGESMSLITSTNTEPCLRWGTISCLRVTGSPVLS